jgi:hypothetical protein
LAAIAVIVGLHFLPMVYLLDKPGYYLTAFAMTGIGIVAASRQARCALP